MYRSKKMIVFLMCICTLIFISSVSYADENFPTKEIEIICPYGAGGGLDVNLRVMSAEAEKVLGVPVLIINKPGAGGAIGFLEGAKAPADGYTLQGITPSVINLQYVADVGHDLKSFDPVILTTASPATITVKTDAPWDTLEEFLDYCRENEGLVTAANSGPGGLWHVCAVGVEAATGVKFTHVPYNSGPTAATAVAGGHCDVCTVSYGELVPFVKGGQLKVLAVASPERGVDPNIPTMKELGYDVDLGVWWGAMAPAGTPREIIDILYQAFEKGAKSPEFKRYIENGSLDYRLMDPDEMKVFLEKEDTKWKELIYAAGANVVD